MPTLYGAVIGGKLYSIDTDTGTETVVGDGIDRSYIGVAVDGLGNLFASALDGNVYKFSLSTGSLLRTYASGIGSNVRAISLDVPGGYIYLAHRDEAWVVQINISTGTVSTAGGWGFGTDVAFSASKGCAVLDGTLAVLWRGASFASMSNASNVPASAEGVALIDDLTAWISAGTGLCYVSGGSYNAYTYSGISGFWGLAIIGVSLYAADTGGKIWRRSVVDGSGTLTAVTSVNRNWQDICTDETVPVPDAPAFFGNAFDGFEAGTVQVELDRKLSLVETLGGRPALIPYAPADKDEWLVTAEFWTSEEQARDIETKTPPRFAPTYPGISVPARNGENTFGGLAPAYAGTGADTYIDAIMLEPLTVLGQKAVRTDLWGYRAHFSLSCSSISNPYSSNPATTPTTTVPTWLPSKWRVHGITDGSNERRVIGGDGKWTGSGNPIAVNQIRPVSIQCDHLTTAQMDELVAFFRGIRGTPFDIGFYPGPVGAHSPARPDVIATKLTFARDAGLLWSATLEVVAA